MKAIALGFHDVVEGARVSPDLMRPCPAHYALTVEQFKAHVVKLRNNCAKTRISAIASKRRWDRNIPIFLTFDDGEVGAYTWISKELETLGLRGHFFVTTNWIGKPGFLHAGQIRELHDRGHVIGSHTCSHPARMSSLSWPALLDEWSKSRAILSEIVGREVEVASVADGYYSRKVAEAASVAGINVLFTSQPTTAVTQVDDCLVIGRFAILGSSSTELSCGLASSLPAARWRQAAFWQVKELAKMATGPHYNRLRKVMLRAG